MRLLHFLCSCFKLQCCEICLFTVSSTSLTENLFRIPYVVVEQHKYRRWHTEWEMGERYSLKCFTRLGKREWHKKSLRQSLSFRTEELQNLSHFCLCLANDVLCIWIETAYEWKLEFKKGLLATPNFEASIRTRWVKCTF